MNARSKKVLATTCAALIAAFLPAGCGFEAVPGLIGGAAIGTGAGTAPAAGVVGDVAAAAAAAAAK